MRSIRLLFALAILFVAAPTFASGWARAFPELVHSSNPGIARVTDGLLVHCEGQNITSDLMKLGADGKIAWAEILDHSSVKAATAASEGGAFIGGFDYPGVNTKPYGWVARIGADGAVWWARKLTLADESVKFVTMAPTRDGGVAVAGSTRVSSLLLKFDGDGNLQWQKLFDINDIDHIKSISATHDGGLVVAIETVCQSVLLGLAPSGDVKWRGAYTRCTSFNSVMETADGSIVTTGKKIESEVAYAMVMKTDSQGRVAWAKGIPIHDGEALSSVTETEAGRYLISGSTRTYGAGKESALAISLSSDGSIAWQRAIGGSDEVVYPPAMAARVPGPSQGDAAIVVHMNSAIRVIDLDDGGGTGGCARVAPTVVPWLPIKIEMEASDFPIRKAGLTIDKFTLTAKRAAFTSSAVCAADGEDQQLAAVIAEKVQKVPKQLAPAAVPTTLQAEWQAFQDPIQKLLATKAFDQLDAMADRLRADRSLWQGGPKLEWFYFVVSGRFSTKEERIKRNEILQEWVTARPQSAAARVSLMKSLQTQAWSERGGGYSDSITPEAGKKYEELQEKVSKFAADSEVVAAKDPEYYATLIEIRNGGDSQGIIARAEQLPPYPRLYMAAANYLLPQWGGAPEEYRKLAEHATERTKSLLGEAMYPALAYKAMANVICCGEPAGLEAARSAFGAYQFDWQRVRRGYTAILAREPQSNQQGIAHAYAQMAWIARDRETAAEVFGRSDVTWDRVAQVYWPKKSDYDSARAWALTPNAMRAPQPQPSPRSVPPATAKDVPLVAPKAPAKPVVATPIGWPAILLLNDIQLTGNVVNHDLKSFLVEGGNGPVAISTLQPWEVLWTPSRDPRPTIGSAMPAPPVQRLRSRLVGWTMHSPSDSRQTIRVSGIATSQRSPRLGVALAIASGAKLPVQVLKPRLTAIEFEPVFVIGCHRQQGTCVQHAYNAQIKVTSGDDKHPGPFGMTLEEAVDLGDLLGAPVIDTNGAAAGVVISVEKETQGINVHAEQLGAVLAAQNGSSEGQPATPASTAAMVATDGRKAPVVTPIGWPAILLLNDVQLGENLVDRNQKSFMVDTGTGLIVISAIPRLPLPPGALQTHGYSVGSVPTTPMVLLRSRLQAWTFHPPSDPKQTITASGIATNQASQDIGIALAVPSRPKFPVLILRPRPARILFEDVFVIGCRRENGVCVQQAYNAKVVGQNSGSNTKFGKFSLRLENDVDLDDLLGAPIIDTDGAAAGVVTYAQKEAKALDAEEVGKVIETLQH